MQTIKLFGHEIIVDIWPSSIWGYETGSDPRLEIWAGRLHIAVSRVNLQAAPLHTEHKAV